MIDRQIYLLPAQCCALCSFPSTSASADESPDDFTAEVGEKCVDTKKILRTDVVNEKNIVFYMRGGKIYQNALIRRCPRLARRGRFSYRTTHSRLCETDTIHVLETFAGRLTRGTSCRIGKFYPITEDEVRVLTGHPAIEAQPIPPPVPEQPD